MGDDVAANEQKRRVRRVQISGRRPSDMSTGALVVTLVTVFLFGGAFGFIAGRAYERRQPWN